jgi:phage terminase large subunit GpA-like protein
MERSHKASTTQSLLSEAIQTVRPVVPVDIVDWCERYRILSPESSSEPGPFRINRSPYAAEILRACVDPAVREVAIMGASQTVKTEIVLNLIAWRIMFDPAPSLLVTDNLLSARALSEDRIGPMVRDSKVLHNRVSLAKGPDAESSTYKFVYRDGHLTLVGSNSSSGVSMRPVKHLYFDECDRFAHEVATKEGHAIDLAKIRKTTFPEGKILLVSSPTIAGQSRIEAAFLESTQEHWYLPCPGCGVLQRLVWSRIDFETGKVRCEGCNELFSQAAWLRGTGQWRAHAAGARVRGFHIPGLLSTFLPWREMVDEFRAASQLSQEGDHSKLKVFVNTRLAEPWTAPSVQIDEADILSRREYFSAELPDGIKLLLASIDSQDASLEYLVAGIGRRRELWLLERSSIPGDLAKDGQAMYAEVDSRILQRVWRFADGKGLRLKRAVQDSGGHHGSVINAEVRKRARTMITYRGGPSKVSGALYHRNRLTQERVSLLYGASDLGKDLIFSLLKVLQPGPGCIHIPFDSDFHHGFGEDFADELTAERKEIEWRGGERHTRWRLKASHRHNEALDLMVMLLILHESMGIKENVEPDYCDLGDAAQKPKQEPKALYGVIHEPDREEMFWRGGVSPGQAAPKQNSGRYGVQGYR